MFRNIWPSLCVKVVPSTLATTQCASTSAKGNISKTATRRNKKIQPTKPYSEKVHAAAEYQLTKELKTGAVTLKDQFVHMKIAN
jgi:hypothetical protein